MLIGLNNNLSQFALKVILEIYGNIVIYLKIFMMSQCENHSVN